MGNPQPFPGNNDAGRAYCDQRPGALRQLRVGFKKRLDLAGAGLAEPWHYALPAAPAGHAYRQVRKSLDAIRS